MSAGAERVTYTGDIMKIRTRGFGIALATWCLSWLCLPAGAQSPASQPSPKTPDGRPDLTGIWFSTGGTLPFEFDTKKSADGSIATTFRKDSNTMQVFKSSFMPYANPPQYKPEFQARLKEIQAGNLNRQDNTFVCGQAGLPRVGPPEQISQTAGQVVFLNTDLAGMAFRVVPLDGRPHRDTDPSFYGVGVGHWEGDTLVVDSRNFVTDTWMGEEGFFHSEQMRVIERFRRVGDTIEYNVTVEDPGVLAQPWVKPARILTKSDRPLEEPYPCDPQVARVSFDTGRHDQRGK